MKTKIILTTLFVLLACQPLLSQTYSPVDSAALLAIDASCDASDQLNWNTEPNPGNWTGITWWTDSVPYKVKYIEIGFKLLTGNMNVSSLDRMLELWVINNQLTGLTFSGLTSLWRIYCSNNQLTHLDLSAITKLRELSVSDNLLDSLDLSNAPDMTYLYCQNNQLVSLNITGVTKLMDFYCLNNQLDTLKVTDMPDLGHLSCDGNHLTKLTVKNNPSLKTLSCSANQLDSLDVSTLTSLQNLYCYSNHLLSLDVSPLINLVNLYCNNNQLTNLDVANLTNLGVLSCAENQLASLNVSGLTKLANLFCSSNKILTSLDASGLPSLSTLACNDNQLTSLDLSGLTNLTNLICDYNQITSLDVTGLSQLTALYCNNNKLTSLDVSNLTSLNSFYCYHNKLPFSSLATYKKYNGLYADPMDSLYSPVTLARLYSINYSAEALIHDTATTFIFYKNDVPVDTNKYGFYTANDTGTYYCKMTNDCFNALVLTTSKITISGDTEFLYIDLGILYLNDSAKSNKSIKITSNTQWNVTYISNTWITVSKFVGILNDSIIVTAAANPDTTVRQGLVVVSILGSSWAVNVVQAAKPYLSDSETTTHIPATANSTLMFDIKSNTSWTINIPETWLTANPSSGSNNHTITLTAEANPDYTERNTAVNISGTGIQTIRTFTVIQDGKTLDEIALLTGMNATLYPNPVINILKLRLSQEVLPSSISIYTLDGKQLLLSKTSESVVDIDMTKYNSGIYVLKIMTSGQTIEKKIIKQ